MNMNVNPPTSEEEQAFLVSHICQGFQQLDVLEKFKNKFSKDLKTKKFEPLFQNIDDESKRALLAAAQKYDWFIPESPQYCDFSLLRILNLSTSSWPMEQRAYILHFEARGLTKKKILANFNKQYRPVRTLGGLSQELTYLNSKPELVTQLRDESDKFLWWTPAPEKGDKDWNAMNRQNHKMEARGRRRVHDSQFQRIEQDASRAAAQDEAGVEGTLFGVEEGPNQLSYPSFPPPRFPSEAQASFRTPSPSPFLLSSPPADAPQTPSPFATRFDNPHGYEDDDVFYSKPLHSPDAASSSFPSPDFRRFPVRSRSPAPSPAPRLSAQQLGSRAPSSPFSPPPSGSSRLSQPHFFPPRPRPRPHGIPTPSSSGPDPPSRRPDSHGLPTPLSTGPYPHAPGPYSHGLPSPFSPMSPSRNVPPPLPPGSTQSRPHRDPFPPPPPKRPEK